MSVEAKPLMSVEAKPLEAYNISHLKRTVAAVEKVCL